MAKKKEIKLPVKNTMNLYQPTKKDNPKAVVALFVFLFILCAILLGRFVIYDRIVEINDLKQQVANKEDELMQVNTKFANYYPTREKYYRYSDAYDQGQLKLVNRIEIINLIEDVTDKVGEINNFSITDNQVAISVLTNSLAEVSELKQLFEDCDFVSDLIVNTSAKSDGTVLTGAIFNCIVLEDE